MKKRNLKNKKSGFTIIEMMIAIAIFLIVVMIGMGALLNANAIHRKTQNTRSIMDNLSFIMEDMSRNIRTGSEYSLDGDTSFSFLPANETTNHWKYFFDNNGNLEKTDSSGTSVLNSPEISFSTFGSGFTVVGQNPSDDQQPFVTIRLVGKISSPNGDIPFNLQTSVSQRAIDIAATPVVEPSSDNQATRIINETNSIRTVN